MRTCFFQFQFGWITCFCDANWKHVGMPIRCAIKHFSYIIDNYKCILILINKKLKRDVRKVISTCKMKWFFRYQCLTIINHGRNTSNQWSW